MTRIAMLKSVRYSGLRDFAFSVVWLHALATPTSRAAYGPRMMIAAMSTTYDTDMLEPLAIGNCTLNAEVSDDNRIRKTSGRIGENVARGSRVKNRVAPSAITARMYQRPRGGRSRSKTVQVYFFDMRRARVKRGRPSKFGRPSQIVALTLPDEVIRGLRRVDHDLAWAIVHMFERGAMPAPAHNGRQADAELVTIGEGRSLIVEIGRAP